MLYWATRVLLVIAWLAVAWLARTRGGRLGGWRVGVGAGVLFASVRAWPWNYLLLDGAREVLHAAGAYDERFWLKLALAVAVAGVVAFGVLTSRWRRLTGPAVVARAGVAMQATLLAIETASLDDALPGVLFEQPCRYGLEGVFAAFALAGLWRVRQRAASEVA